MKKPTEIVALPGTRNGSLSYNGNGNGKLHHSDKPEFELLPFAETLYHRWPLLLFGGAALALIGLLAGAYFWTPNFTASAQLIAYDSPNATEIFGANQVSPQTITSVLRSPELLREAGTHMDPPQSASDLENQFDIAPDRDSDTVTVTATADSAKRAVDLANLYANEAVRFTQRLQARSADELDQFYGAQIARVNSEIANLDKEAQSLPREVLTQVTAPQPNSLLDQLQTARIQLAQLLSKYTDMHPLVQAQRAEIAAIETQLSPSLMDQPTTPTNSAVAEALPVTGEKDPEIIRGKLQSFESARLELLGKQQAVQTFAANPPGFCKLLAAATEQDVVAHGRLARIIILGFLAGLLGVAGTGGLILMSEVTDNRLKTSQDVTRVTKLPVLAEGGDLMKMSDSARYHWGFRTWQKLQGQLQQSGQGLIFGVMSGNHGDGCQLWVSSLSQTAALLGFRVLTVFTREEEVPNGIASSAHIGNYFASGNAVPVTPSVLAAPEIVAEQLQALAPGSQPALHVPLPGWIWNLERRRQWQSALKTWAQIENIVIIVELPPASVPEAMLLAEHLPNIVWLTDCRESLAMQTREHIETLRNARCNLAGAVLHRASDSLLKKRFARWIGGVAMVAALHASIAFCQQTGDALPAPNQSAVTSPDQVQSDSSASLSVTEPQRAAWQEHLTLGPGDVLDFSLYGSPELTQLSVPIGPDGRVSFLEAQDVMAAGLTVDELRAKMDQKLSEYRRAARTIITPVAFNSKKYYLLGSVERAGVYTLDRPMTIVEAIARAKGLQTAMQARNVVEVADFEHAFLARDGQRMPIDFSRLFEHGDLSQNIPLEPGDYLYLPSAELKQVYVVGEVNSPGAADYNPNLSVVSAIAELGGFTDRAWKHKVLVVRGSLNSPQTYVVNVNDVLSAKMPDFRLQPGDIIYVSHRPWIYAEDVLNMALTSFIQSVVITWTGLHVGPFITSPIF